jgi:hypothetical protein
VGLLEFEGEFGGEAAQGGGLGPLAREVDGGGVELLAEGGVLLGEGLRGGWGFVLGLDACFERVDQVAVLVDDVAA